MATLPFGEGRMRLFLVLGALSASFSLDMTPVAAQRAALQITDACRGCFRRDGVVVLRGLVEQAPQPLKRQGCPCSEDIEEYAGVHSECRLAASLACTLLRADAVATHRRLGQGVDPCSRPLHLRELDRGARHDGGSRPPREPVVTLKGYRAR